MPSVVPPARIQVGLVQLQRAFPDNPQMALAMQQLFQAVSAAALVPGELKPFAGATAPNGWLACDGSAVSRTDFPDLFQAIGTDWGPGDGATTFNLPDLRGKVPMGADGTYPLGSSGGAATTTLTVAQLPAHNHPVTDPGHTHAVTDPGHTHTVTDPGHTHAITDPGHTHAVTDPGHVHGVTDPGHVHGVTDPGHVHASQVAGSTANLAAGTAADATIAGNTGSATTGLSVNSHATGLTVNSANTGVTNNSAATGVTNVTADTGVTNVVADTGVTNNNATTGVTTDDTGGGDPVPTLSPFAAVNWMVKT